MADVDVTYSIENEQQLWDELDEIVAGPCPSHESIDHALRSWLSLVATCRDRYLESEDDVALCSQMLADSQVFCENKNYVRTQIVYSLLQEEDFGLLHVIANFLLLDGRSDNDTFRRMIEEGCFSRLLDILRGCRDHDRRLHRLLLELMYEMSRIERLRPEDLMHVDDAFITYLFQLIESLSEDMNDPYHYPVIRVLLVLNEQYMVASTLAAADRTAPSASLTNRVVKVLSISGDSYRTSGQNLILLLNRETETSLQLLILKLLYLLFTTHATYEYFYTNDLRVLLDVIIRNLLDLPNELTSLRHTYLRVLYPLLSNTQLNQSPHYKREEVLKVINILGGSGNYHFAPADETTLRLVDRVSKVSWLSDGYSGETEVTRKFLGISLSESQGASSVSVVDVAAVTEKPGVKTPSRMAEGGAEVKGDGDFYPNENATTSVSNKISSIRPKKALPEVPKHRHGVSTVSPASSKPPMTERVKGDTQRKMPPKLPPPRRHTKLKAVTTSSETLGPNESLHSVTGSTPVS